MSRIVTLYFPLSNLDTGTYQEYPVPTNLDNFFVAEVDVDTLDQYQFVIPDSGENKGKPKLVTKSPNSDYYTYNFETNRWEIDQKKSSKFLEDKVDKLGLALYDYIENKRDTLANLKDTEYAPIKPFLDKYKEAGFTGRVPIKLNLYLKEHSETTAEKLYENAQKIDSVITAIDNDIEDTVYSFSDEATTVISDTTDVSTKITKVNDLITKYKSEADTKYNLDTFTKG